MAAQYIPIKRISSLDTPIKAEKLDGSLFTTENQAHEFIISVRKNGVKQTVTGSVSGKFIRANGTTIFLQGSIVDGDAVVRLHQDCYNVQGRFTFNIFNTQSGVTTCIYSAVGKIDMGSTETVIDAGDVVPDVSDVVAKQEEMTQVIADARTATTAANTAATNVGSIVARPYSPPYKAGEHCTQNGNLYNAKQDIPEDEEWTASHWTQIVMGDEVTDLKSALTKTDNMIVYADDYNLPLAWEYGNINSSGENANEDRHFYARTKAAFTTEESKDVVLEVVSGSGITNVVVVEYNALTHAMTNRIVYYSSSFPYIHIQTDTTKEYRLCIMGGSSLTINLNAIYNYATVTTETEIQKLEQGINEINDIIDASGVNPSDNVTQIEYTATLGSMTKTGYINTSATDYGYTSKIPVETGDIIRSIPYGVGSDLTMRVVTAFSGETVIPDKGVENVAEYTVPDGIDYIVVTGYVARANNPSTIPYLFRFSKGYADKKTDSNGFVVKQATVNSGDQINIPLNNVSKNVVLSVDATVDTFNALEFGRTGITNKIAVTSENVIFYDENGSVLSTTAHGLTIENTISVRIIHDAETNMDQVSVIVSSNGIMANPVTKGWSAYRRGNVYVKSVGTSLTDCTCGFAMQDINKAIWIFGDSACSYTYNRWVGQLVLAGYAKNVLVNAYPGEDASQNIPSLMNLINKGHPKAIVWVNGGNDGTDNTTTGKPNKLWMNAVQIFLTACISRGIIPILCTRATFPGNNPPATLQNHEYKNAWVRESGYRYIDFAKAVGANSSGEWYPGMQFSDGVHPTEQGAIALFNRAVADCPEFMEQ